VLAWFGDENLRTILKRRLPIVQGSLRCDWVDLFDALDALQALSDGRFVCTTLEAIDKTLWRIDPEHYRGNIRKQVRIFKDDYDCLDTGLQIAFLRHNNLMKPGREPKNKGILPRTLREFFYNQFRQDSYFLHLLFDGWYDGFCLGSHKKYV